MNQQGARRIRHTYIRAAFAAILPGEDLIAYLDMLEELAAELLPDTSLQWDALYIRYGGSGAASSSLPQGWRPHSLIRTSRLMTSR
jgi:hypothetical protein